MTEKEKLIKRLTGIKNFGVDIVWENNPTPEEICKSLNDALDAIERGDYEELTDFDD